MKVITGSYRPKADFRNKSVHESLADTIYNSPSMGEQTRLDYFQIIKDDDGNHSNRG